MNHNVLYASLDALVPALANHVWQSTLFAVAVGLLVLTLRKNQAHVRYCLWLAASLKFLIPFSWLVAFGARLSWLRGGGVTNPGIYFVVEQVGQPFTSHPTSVLSGVGAALTVPAGNHLLYTILGGIWLAGFVAVVVVWCVRWLRVSGAIQESIPLREGREAAALRRLERVTQLPYRLEMLLSRITLEPGIFGIRRPVLVWPEGISEHLDDSHLESIIAHELCHVRRRDNLVATIHMAVEAIFWFHPLVWWLGARLLDERERACDEQVLDLGSDRRVYAESILKVCEFCVGSPLPCVAGVTGSDLKKRMVHIMSEQVVRKLDVRKKLLVGMAGILAVVAPIMFGLATASPSRAESQPAGVDASTQTFQSVTIKPSQSSTPLPTYAGTNNRMVRMMFGPDGFIANNVTMKSLIQEAYDVQANQIEGGPDWLNTDLFDVDAKTGKSNTLEPTAANIGPGLNHNATQRMLQSALADRINLVVRHETKDLPTYALVIADGGSKLKPSSENGNQDTKGATVHKQYFRANGMRVELGNGQVMGLTGQGIFVSELANQLSRQLGTLVVDKTGLKGSYDFNLNWTADPSEAKSSDADPSVPKPAGSSLLNAVQEQLGLKLEPQQGPTEVLVIEHIDKPTAE